MIKFFYCWMAIFIIASLPMSFASTPTRLSSASVRVDNSSNDYPSSVFNGKVSPVPNRKNVRVSDGLRTYQLTCNIESSACHGPALGSKWQMIVQARSEPEELDDKDGEFPYQGYEVYLHGTSATLGPYWLVADMPSRGEENVSRAISECKAREQGINENDCVVWLARRSRIQEQGCTSEGAGRACSNFQELLQATDPDLLDLIARLRHVYVCYRPETTHFFIVYFPEPIPWSWSPPVGEEAKIFGLRSNDLLQYGSPGVHHYEQGVQSDSYSGLGVWRYARLSSDISVASLALVATSNDAKFSSEDPNLKIYIDGTKVSVEEEDKNKAGSKTQHTLLLQRSTGRFREKYEYAETGTFIDGYSGECREVPEATQ